MKANNLRMCHVIILLALLSLLALGQTLLSARATTEPADKVAATVNGERIPESELTAALPDDAFANTLDDLKQSKLKRIIEETIQSQFLAERKIAVSEEDVSDGVKKFEKMVMTPGCPCCGGGYSNLKQFMEINAFTMQEVRRRVSNDIGLKLYVERLTTEQTAPQVLADAVKKNRAQIEANYVQGYVISFNYMRDPSYFSNKKNVREAKEKLAQTALERLKKGESFEKVAKEMSEDDASAPKGGLQGCVRTDFMGQDVEQVLRKLEPGVYSGIIKTPWGCSIVMRKKLTEEDVLSILKEQAAASAEEQVYQEFKSARERAKIQYGPSSTSSPAPAATK